MALSHGDLTVVPDRDILRGHISPTARVQIPNTVNHDVYRAVGMPTKDHISLVFLPTVERSIMADLIAQAQPLLTGLLHPSGCPVMRVELLNDEIDPRGNGSYNNVLCDPLVKLVTVDGEVSIPMTFPYKFFMDGHTEKVREDLCYSAVVITNHPHHLNALTRVGRLPDVRQELPIVTREAFEVQIIEDVSIKDQSLEPQHPHELDQSLGPRDIRPEVDVRHDQGVEIGIMVKVYRLEFMLCEIMNCALSDHRWIF